MAYVVAISNLGNLWSSGVYLVAFKGNKTIELKKSYFKIEFFLVVVFQFHEGKNPCFTT